MSSFDIIVVGTRCAGASLAMLLARKGYRVLGVDRSHFPSDTLSTHFLWPRTTHYLDTWGLLDRLAATGCPLIDTVTLHYGSALLRGRPDPVGSTSAMYCPRRTILDALLVEEARASGAEICEGVLVRDLLREGGRVVGVSAVDAEGNACELKSKIVIGADGASSTIARLVGSEFEVAKPSMTGGFYAYWRGVPTDGVEFYIRHGKDVLVFPTHDDMTCIWAGRSQRDWDNYRTDKESMYLATLDPDLRARAMAGTRVTPLRGSGKLPNFYRRAAGEGWALVGDAAYHRDPVTGMGIGDAFLGSSLLADSIHLTLGSARDEPLQEYAQELKRRTQDVFEYTLRSAALDDPEPSAHLYEQIGASVESTRQFMNVLSGSQSMRSFFRYVSAATPTGV